MARNTVHMRASGGVIHNLFRIASFAMLHEMLAEIQTGL